MESLEGTLYEEGGSLPPPWALAPCPLTSSSLTPLLPSPLLPATWLPQLLLLFSASPDFPYFAQKKGDEFLP